ncbi:hypothetical protein ACH3VR_03845 [Microbacterium sp. B2969]|uniref:Uncharacterized protein n=1 Tax=Microbacterium alkaliflavum TaxID=3248839 RepID=A0ABW7Q5J1_9MICO
MDVEQFREQDREWRRRLQGLSLVTEANIDIAEATSALRDLSDRALRSAAGGGNRAAVLKRYAPTLLVGLTAVASSKYDEGTFWPRVGEVVGSPMTQQVQGLFSDTFRYGLDLLGLSRFDTPLRNLGEILMHAGIPVASVADLVTVLQKRDASSFELTGAGMCSWASSLTRGAAAAKGLDAPTWRFLTSGGEVAADLIDRFLDALDLAKSAAPDALSLESLPTHLGDELRRLLTSGRVRATARRSRRRVSRSVPRLAFVSGEIQLDLPPLEQHLNRDVAWQITVAGESRFRRVRAPWPGDTPDRTREAISRPAVSAVVALMGEEMEWTVPIVDTSCPVLAFDATSRLAITPGTQLPKGRVWVAFPNETDSSVADALEYDGSIALIEQLDAPFGWDGWSFALVDVSGITRLRPRAGDDYRWRYVSSITRPALADVDVLPYLRSASGSYILAERPMITLPAARVDVESGVGTTVWTITVLSSDGEVLSTRQCASDVTPVIVDPWPDVETFIGEFEVRVQGPLGRGSVHSIAIAERVTVSSSTDFRWFTPRDGLEPCSLEITTPGESVRVELDNATSANTAEIAGAAGTRPLTVVTDVDFMWVSASKVAKPGTGPAPLERESLPETVLRLNTIPKQRGAVHVVAAGSTVQTIPLDANATGIAVLNLAMIADTAERHGVVSLRYEAGDKSTVIGLVRPRQLVSSIEVQEDTLRLSINGDSVSLELGVYLDFAPWRRPEIIRVGAGEVAIPLPACLNGRGPAVIVARVEDPWSESVWPDRLPRRDDNTHHLDLPAVTADDLDDQFLCWVGGDLPLPATPASLAFAIDVYASLRAARSTRPKPLLLAEVAALSRAQGDSFLDAARAGSWSRLSHTRLLAEGWAATAPGSKEPIRNATWMLSPFLGVLESINLVHESPSDLLEIADAVLGDSARSILDDGVDPHAAVGAFRHEAEILATWPAERIEEVWRAAAPIPGALLNADQRMLHARELFDSRVLPLTREAAASSRVVLRATHEVLQDALGDRVRGPIRARSGSEGWPSLPCVSLSLSLLARLAARGHDAAMQTFTRYRSRFADLAEAAPSFIEQDLVLAELWMTRWEDE